MSECVEVMEKAFLMLASEPVNLPVRQYLWLPEKRGALALMPVHYGNVWGMKVSSTMPTNLGTKFPSHQGCVLLFEAQHGQMLAMIDCTEITAIRTGASSAVATKILSNPNSRTLAIFGAGHQAIGHLHAMMVARPNLKVLRVYDKFPESAEAFCKMARETYGLQASVAKSVAECTDGADIICTCTPAKDAFLDLSHVRPGTHINAVGSAKPFTREITSALVKAGRFFVDRVDSCLADAGDFILAEKEGVVTKSHILGDLSDMVSGKVACRTSASDITIFENVGIAVMDLAAAEYLYGKAKKQNIGTWVKLNSYR